MENLLAVELPRMVDGLRAVGMLLVKCLLCVLAPLEAVWSLVTLVKHLSISDKIGRD